MAISQIYITHSDRLLTPAKGGGFGMFSTVDKLNNRIVLVYGLFDNQRVKVNVDTKDPFFKEKLDHHWQKVRAYPTYSNLRKLGKALRDIKFSKRPDYVVIEVKKCSFNPETAEVEYISVNEVTLPYR